MRNGALLRPLLSRRGRGRRHHFYQLDPENKGRICGYNDVSGRRILHIFPAVAEAWRNGEKAVPALFHAPYAYLEARNNAFGAEYEGKGLVVVGGGAVEDGSVGEPPFIEDADSVAGLGLQAGTDFDVLTLDRSGLFGRGCRPGLGGGRPWTYGFK